MVIERKMIQEVEANFQRQFGNQIVTVDSHTAGEPTRLIVGGLPSLPGATINDKRSVFQRELDQVRLLLTREPRGHRDSFAAIVTEPVSAEGDFGLIYMDACRYPHMCGHATIGAVTTLIELGWLHLDPGVTEQTIVVDTPSGTVRAKANLIFQDQDQVRVDSVDMELDSAFVQAMEQKISLPDGRRFSVDLVCVGGYFAMLSADQIELPLTAENATDLAKLGMILIEASNQQMEIHHPTNKFVNTVDVVEFYGLDPAGNHQNVVIYGESHVDRSPCGTGTAAKMALLHKQGKMSVGDTIINKGPLGTQFRGRIIAETKVGPFPAILPEIRGSAHITGWHRFVIGEDDPYPAGFLI
jgi:proline racemase